MKFSKIYQSINVSSIFFIVGLLVTSYAQVIDKIDFSVFEFLKENVGMLLLSLFILIFKLKTMLDDHQHFSEIHQDSGNVFRHIGFILALISWIFLGLASYFVKIPTRASELIVISIVVSTAWIIVHLIEIALDKNRRRTELIISLMREKWALINIGYILLLGVFSGWIDPVIEKGDNVSLYLLIGLLIFDFVTSRAKILSKK